MSSSAPAWNNHTNAHNLAPTPQSSNPPSTRRRVEITEYLGGNTSGTGLELLVLGCTYLEHEAARVQAETRLEIAGYRIMQLENQNARLKKVRDETSPTRFRALCSRIDDLQGRVEELESEVEELHEKIEEGSFNLATERVRRSHAEQRTGNLLLDLRDVEEELEGAERELETAREETRRVKSRCARLASKRKDADEAQEGLEARLAEEVRVREEADGEVDRLRRENAELLARLGC